MELINEIKTHSALKPHAHAITLQSLDPHMQTRIATNLVQQIPYKYSQQEFINTHPWVLYHFASPYEVLYSDTGQCAEKSTLLAGCLNESGYNSAIISFTGKHSVAGTGGSVTDQYHNTCYIMRETTNQEPIGGVSDEIGSIRQVKKIPGGGRLF